MPADHHLHSCRRHFRLWVMALLLCSLSVTDFSSWGHVVERCETANEERVVQSDGLRRCMMLGCQAMPAGIIVPAKNGERIGNTRPVRLTPTNGGKPGRMMERWMSVNSIHLSNLYAQLLRLYDSGMWAWAASSRLYYVIALRRILC